MAVVMGSRSDWETMRHADEVLTRFGVPHLCRVVSAHRTPGAAAALARSAERNGLEVIIAGAGAAAHLPGVLASWTTLPVIGVPLASSELRGLDSLYAIVQMPAGIPVATVAIGSAGARNAAYLAAQMLGIKHEQIRNAYERYRQSLAGG